MIKVRDDSWERFWIGTVVGIVIMLIASILLWCAYIAYLAYNGGR